MKRFVLLLAIGLLLVACGAATTSEETAVSVPEEPARPEASPVEEAVVEDSAPESASSDSSTNADIPNFPATNVQEASIVRDRDWTVGTDDPLVTIIEYGDFQ